MLNVHPCFAFYPGTDEGSEYKDAHEFQIGITYCCQLPYDARQPKFELDTVSPVRSTFDKPLANTSE